ncbi:hypothetical protein ASF33_14790 [Methylobacterium sp. Leaf92]|nr:hypothetical protein ASF33_14790 [Methylobacterium sp. Leaf92]
MAMPSLAPLHIKRRPSDGLYARPAPTLEADEAGPGSAENWQAVAPVRPDTAHVRAPRFLDLGGELISALVLIAGGVLAYGHFPVA